MMGKVVFNPFVPGGNKKVTNTLTNLFVTTRHKRVERLIIENGSRTTFTAVTKCFLKEWFKKFYLSF